MASSRGSRALEGLGRGSLQTGSSAGLSGSSLSVAAARHRHSPATSGLRPSASGSGVAKQSFRGHQRRQSVARLLPDISKLRLLSWLVEASSELINCNIAIMDGVYAKLNRSQESLLFWTAAQGGQQRRLQLALGPAPAPLLPPVPNKLVISQQRRKQQKQLAKLQREQEQQQQRKQTPTRRPDEKGAARNHHSLPLTNYDASSMAAVSFISAPSSSLSRRLAGNERHSVRGAPSSGRKRQQQQAACSESLLLTAAANNCDDSISAAIQPFSSLLINNPNQDLNNNAHESDSEPSEAGDLDQEEEELEEDAQSSSAGSSTSSSGFHGIGTSLSSTSSAGSSCSGSSSSGSTPALDRLAGGGGPKASQSELGEPTGRFLSPAEQLSEKIRRTLMEHNYIQNLLVNIIRLHDRQRDLQSNLSRRQMLQASGGSAGAAQQQLPQQKIDLADIADALDDGCLCSCHSSEQHRERAREKLQSSQEQPARCKSSSLPATSTPPSASNQGAPGNRPPARKARRLKKLRGAAGNSSEPKQSRQELLEQLGSKLCETCLETHFWLHGNLNSAELQLEPLPASYQGEQSSGQQLELLNSVVARRNATFIKLVQQEVRATIGKSIELIDLIRREIKSPESIKQKQLMRCFSTSIQLLTSVGNYVVPTQDISSFIPEEIGQNQTSLFSLPSSDFDHLFLYSSGAPPSPVAHQPGAKCVAHSGQSPPANSNYHLAPAPEIPVRRKLNRQRHQQASQPAPPLPADQPATSGPGSLSLEPPSSQQQAAKIKAEEPNPADSSSGASSNNSSAASSIARGAVQQSSLGRAQTSSALLDAKTGHDLSYDAIASLSQQHTPDDTFLQARPKFWQSPKFNFIKKLLHVKEQRLLRQQSKDRRIYNNKVQNKFRLVMMDLTHFNKSQQLLTTENGVNSLLTSMRNVLEFGLYLTLKLY